MSTEGNADNGIIPISDDASDGDVKNVFVSKKEYDRLVGRTTGMEWWAVGVVLVCFFAFVGFMVDAYRFHSETLENYQTTISELKGDRLAELEVLLEQQNQKFVRLETAMSELSTRIHSLE